MDYIFCKIFRSQSRLFLDSVSNLTSENFLVSILVLVLVTKKLSGLSLGLGLGLDVSGLDYITESNYNNVALVHLEYKLDNAILLEGLV